MKSRISSLSKNEDFKNLLSGRKIANQYSTIFFKKISSKNNKYLNVSFVTKKKIGNAVKRNKIKRRLRNIMNDAVKTINMDLNYSYLFIAKKNLYNGNYKMDEGKNASEDFGKFGDFVTKFVVKGELDKIYHKGKNELNVVPFSKK